MKAADTLLASGGHLEHPGIGRLAAPTVILREPAVSGMPTGATQEVRVLTATFGPGDRTVFHSHRAPVTVYVLEGHFTLEIEGRERVVVGPGQAFVEPPDTSSSCTVPMSCPACSMLVAKACLSICGEHSNFRPGGVPRIFPPLAVGTKQ